MKRILRREILIETEQIILLTNREDSKFLICEKCDEESLMVRPESIAKAADLKTREIYRRIETGDVHFTERNTDEIFVCVQTLLGVNTVQEHKLLK